MSFLLASEKSLVPPRLIWSWRSPRRLMSLVPGSPAGTCGKRPENLMSARAVHCNCLVDALTAKGLVRRQDRIDDRPPCVRQSMHRRQSNSAVPAFCLGRTGIARSRVQRWRHFRYILILKCPRSFLAVSACCRGNARCSRTHIYLLMALIAAGGTVVSRRALMERVGPGRRGKHPGHSDLAAAPRARPTTSTPRVFPWRWPYAQSKC